MGIRVKPRARSTRRPQCGVAMVEFLIGLPLLMMLIMGTAEISRAFMQYNTLVKATRDAGRYISDKALLGSTGVVQLSAARMSETKNVLVYGDIVGGTTPALPGLGAANVSITAAGPASVLIVASYPYAPIFATLPMFGLGTDVSPFYTFTASMVVRAL
jgi:Flp pilus assembly protein TadG